MTDNQTHEDSSKRENLSVADASELSRRLVELTSAGKPLAAGLRALVEELPAGRSRRVAARMAAEIERGISLEDVLDTHSRRFPGPLRGLIRAGLRTGRLSETLGRYAADTEKEQSLFRGIWIRLIYPSVLLLIALGLWLGLLMGVAPGYSEIFQDFGLVLPWETQGLVSGTTALKHLDAGSILAFLGATVAYIAITGLLMRMGLIRHVWGSGLILRGLRRRLALSEFSSVAAFLLDAGVPVDEMLQLAGESARTIEMRKAAAFAAVEVASGITLASAIGRALPVSKVQRDLIAWAESAGTLPDTFRMLAEIFEARARVQARRLGTFCSVFAFVLILWSVFFMGSALLSPIIALIRNLGGSPTGSVPETSWWDLAVEWWEILWSSESK